MQQINQKVIRKNVGCTFASCENKRQPIAWQVNEQNKQKNIVIMEYVVGVSNPEDNQ